MRSVTMMSAVKNLIKRLIPYYNQVRCPICGASDRQFRPFGPVPRPNALCPVCGSLERHRMAWLFFQQATDLFDGRAKKMLHVAPEACLARPFSRARELDYLTADLSNPAAMVSMDITDIRYPDNTFDIIFCSHVLEHVLEDRKAMREFRRVLKPQGWAALVVPITGSVTYEDRAVTDPQERERVFGQQDHVRIYGPDFQDRLVEAGFEVRAVHPTDLCDQVTLAMRAIPTTEDPIFFCAKDARGLRP